MIWRWTCAWVAFLLAAASCEDSPSADSDRCRVPDCLIRAYSVRSVDGGAWTDWCYDPAADRPITGSGGKGFTDRQGYVRILDFDNRVGTRTKLMIPDEWWQLPGGGKHFGGWGICPTDAACTESDHGSDCIRLDWNDLEPGAKGFRMTIYQRVDGVRQEDRCDWVADTQVFWPGEWTEVVFEAEYDPETGTFTGFMEYYHPRLRLGMVRVDNGVQILPGNSMPIGLYARWGKMSFASGHVGNGKTCWIRDDVYYVPGDSLSSRR